MFSETEMVKFRAAIESAYTGVCDIIEYTQTTDSSEITRQTLSKTAENVPCRLSYTSKSAAVPNDTVATVAQGVKLFLSPDITVREGSIITVTQDGITREYRSSGTPAVWLTHQEIMLELSKERA